MRLQEATVFCGFLRLLAFVSAMIRLFWVWWALIRLLTFDSYLVKLVGESFCDDSTSLESDEHLRWFWDLWWESGNAEPCPELLMWQFGLFWPNGSDQSLFRGKPPIFRWFLGSICNDVSFWVLMGIELGFIVFRSDKRLVIGILMKMVSVCENLMFHKFYDGKLVFAWLFPLNSAECVPFCRIMISRLIFDGQSDSEEFKWVSTEILKLSSGTGSYLQSHSIESTFECSIGANDNRREQI